MPGRSILNKKVKEALARIEFFCLEDGASCNEDDLRESCRIIREALSKKKNDGQ